MTTSQIPIAQYGFICAIHIVDKFPVKNLHLHAPQSQGSNILVDPTDHTDIAVSFSRTLTFPKVSKVLDSNNLKTFCSVLAVPTVPYGFVRCANSLV